MVDGNEIRGRMLLAAEWGRLPGNQILCEKSFEIFDRPSNLSQHPGCLPWVYEYLLADYAEPARLVESTSSSVLMWMHPYDHGFLDYLMYPFTSNLESFSRDVWRIKAAPFVQAYDEADGSTIFNFNGVNNVRVQSDRPCFYIGGRDNFLHWLIDHLTHAVSPEAQIFGKEACLVTSRLSEWQKQTLNFFGVSNPILELSPPDDRSTFFHFEELIVPVGYPLAARFMSLRQRYAKLYRRPKSKGPSLYLSRGKMRPRHRVSNEDEVAAYFVRIGFDVLYPEQMPLEEVARRCSEARIVVTAPGSANGNYFVFSDADAILIYMVPGFSKNEVSFAQATVGYANLLIFMDRILTVYGRDVQADKPTVVDEDRPELYDLGDLDLAVSKAKLMLEMR